MALIECAECGNKVSTKAASCPKCGAPVSTAIAPTTPMPLHEEAPKAMAAAKPAAKWPWFVIGAFVLVLGFLNMGSSPEARERSTARHAITLCWEDQARKVHDPGVARFIAGACEKMERDFTARYGARP